MKTAQHTPGPWIATSAGIWTATGECMIASLGGRECTASRRAYARKHLGDSENRNRAEMDACTADAALIAAAPDLLAALIEAKEVLESARQYFPSSIKNPDRFRLLNVLANSVDPAIAKATGGAK